MTLFVKWKSGALGNFTWIEAVTWRGAAPTLQLGSSWAVGFLRCLEEQRIWPQTLGALLNFLSALVWESSQGGNEAVIVLEGHNNPNYYYFILFSSEAWWSNSCLGARKRCVGWHFSSGIWWGCDGMWLRASWLWTARKPAANLSEESTGYLLYCSVFSKIRVVFPFS